VCDCRGEAALKWDRCRFQHVAYSDTLQSPESALHERLDMPQPLCYTVTRLTCLETLFCGPNPRIGELRATSRLPGRPVLHLRRLIYYNVTAGQAGTGGRFT
jgi:hypothetical protein